WPVLGFAKLMARRGAIIVQDLELASGGDYDLFLVAFAFFGPFVTRHLAFVAADDAGWLLAFAFAVLFLLDEGNLPRGGRRTHDVLRTNGLGADKLILGKPADGLLHRLDFFGRRLQRRQGRGRDGRRAEARMHDRFLGSGPQAAGPARAQD